MLEVTHANCSPFSSPEVFFSPRKHWWSQTFLLTGHQHLGKNSELPKLLGFSHLSGQDSFLSVLQAALSLFQREKSSVETWLAKRSFTVVGAEMCFWVEKCSGMRGAPHRHSVRADRAMGTPAGVACMQKAGSWSLPCSEQGTVQGAGNSLAAGVLRWYRGHVRWNWETITAWPRLLVYRNSTHTSGLH